MRKHLACTSILVGKDASIDGSTIIARNEDYYGPVGPKTFKVRPANDQQNRIHISPITGVKIPLPKHAMRYTCEPSTCELDYEHLPKSKYAVYEEAGINEENVAMSATETTFTNQRFLGYDPLVKHGINEDSMIMIVLPFIHSAREGVQRLGKLIEKYGTGQSNGISFSDKDEVWYLETAGGHHWAAVRIPDDAYVIAPNQTSIQDLDLHDPKNCLYSPDLPDFVKQHHLNPRPGTFNFRNITGTHTEFDAHYDTSRAWYGLKLFNPQLAKKYAPTSQNIPFIRHAERKLTIEDCGYFLSSHYQQTPYDPMTHPDLYEHPKFRPIAIDRNQVSHILQIRNHVPAKYAALEWIALGCFAFSPYVPFYTNINKTPQNYQIAGHQVTLKSAYWLYKTVAALVEPQYHQVIDDVNAYRDACQSYAIQRINQGDTEAKDLDDEKLTEFLTQHSIETANHISDRTHKMVGKLIISQLKQSKLTF